MTVWEEHVLSQRCLQSTSISQSVLWQCSVSPVSDSLAHNRERKDRQRVMCCQVLCAENLHWWEHCGGNQRNRLKGDECVEQKKKRDESGERIPKARDLLPHWQLNGVCHKRCHHLICTSPLPYISTTHPILICAPLLPRSLSGVWQIKTSRPMAEDPICFHSTPVSISQDLHFLLGRKTENLSPILSIINLYDVMMWWK